MLLTLIQRQSRHDQACDYNQDSWPLRVRQHHLSRPKQANRRLLRRSPPDRVFLWEGLVLLSHTSIMLILNCVP
jgi:hypothetical protein